MKDSWTTPAHLYQVLQYYTRRKAFTSSFSHLHAEQLERHHAHDCQTKVQRDTVQDERTTAKLKKNKTCGGRQHSLHLSTPLLLDILLDDIITNNQRLVLEGGPSFALEQVALAVRNL